MAVRRGELLAIRWAQADLERGFVHLAADTTKTARARTLRVKEILKRRHNGPDGKKLGAAAFVFGNEVGERIQSVKTAWNAACRRAGIVGLHLHDLRREAASRLLEDGMPLQHVSMFLGHTSGAQTATYLSATESQLTVSLAAVVARRQRRRA